MMRIQPDIIHHRVVLREGSRNLGELIYQIKTGGEWLSPVQIEGDDDTVVVELTGRSLDSGQVAQVIDHFERAQSEVTVHRTWRLPAQRSYRLQVDFRSHSEGPGVGVLPAVSVCDYRDRSPSPQLASPAHLLSFPGAAVSSESDASSLLLLDGDFKMLSPSIHIYESEHRHAIQVQLPGVERIVRSQLSALDDQSRPRSTDDQGITSREVGVDGTVKLSFRLYLNQSSVGQAMLSMQRDAWRPVSGNLQNSDLDTLAADYRQLKLGHLNRHVQRDRRGVYGLRPSRDDRRRRSPRVHSALAPYWSLIAARAFAQEGRRSNAKAYLSEAVEICRFFLEGKRPDELYADSFDPVARRWGTVIEGAFHPGSTGIGPSAAVGRLIAETYAELRAGRMDAEELARAAGDLGAVLAGRQEEHGLWDGADVLSSAEVISLLVRLEAIKGRNAARRSALKRAAEPFCASVANGNTLETTGSVRDRLVTVLRALIDLARYLKSSVLVSRAREIAGLLVSWVFTVQLPFPSGSHAARLGVETVGLSVCSVSRTHIDFEGLPAAYELARAHSLSGDELFETVAARMFVAHLQCVGGLVRLRRLDEGGQPAEVDYTDWSSRRRRHNSAGSLLGARIGQSAGALYAATLLIENYPEMLNLRSSSS